MEMIAESIVPAYCIKCKEHKHMRLAIIVTPYRFVQTPRAKYKTIDDTLMLLGCSDCKSEYQTAPAAIPKKDPH